MKILGLSIEIKIKALKILTCFLVFLLVINLGMPVSQLKLFVVFVIYSINYYLFKIKIKSLKFQIKIKALITKIKILKIQIKIKDFEGSHHANLQALSSNVWSLMCFLGFGFIFNMVNMPVSYLELFVFFVIFSFHYYFQNFLLAVKMKQILGPWCQILFLSICIHLFEQERSKLHRKGNKIKALTV